MKIKQTISRIRGLAVQTGVWLRKHRDQQHQPMRLAAREGVYFTSRINTTRTLHTVAVGHKKHTKILLCITSGNVDRF